MVRLLVIVSLSSARQDRQDIERTSVSVERKVHNRRSPGPVRTALASRLSSFGRGLVTDCPIVLTASVSPVTAAFIAALAN